jgi:ABC-type uncharacterized transport system substrate-binding protein
VAACSAGGAIPQSGFLFHQSAAARVAVLVNPSNATAESTSRDVTSAARAMGLQVQILKATSSREIDAAFAALVRELCQPALGKPAGLR